MRLAGGDDSDLRRLWSHDVAVDAIDTGERCDRCKLGRQPAFDLERRQIWPADMQAVGVGFWSALLSDRVRIRPAADTAIDQIQVDRRSAFDHFGNRGHADPGATKA